MANTLTVTFPDITDIATFRCLLRINQEPNSIRRSRPKSTAKNQLGMRPTQTAKINNNAAHTLSAIGSSTLPSSDTWFIQRANQPSRKSLEIAQTTNSVNARSGLPSGGPINARGIGTSIRESDTTLDRVNKLFFTSITFPSIFLDDSK